MGSKNSNIFGDGILGGNVARVVDLALENTKKN